MSRAATLPAVGPAFAWRSDGPLTWLAASVPGAQAAFSTRRGGVSEGPFESLNLGVLTDDEPARVRRNRGLLAAALGREPGSVVMGHQVHGADVQVRTAPGGEFARVDAQVTAAPDLTPLVLVADCVPLVVAAPGAVAAVHCGWRGVAGGIVRAATAEARALGGEPLAAVVGPGIGPCCYEVGPEVLARFGAAGPTLDLPALVAAELHAAGVPADRVAVAGVCVSCHPELFFSHRRDGGTTGRQAGLAWLAP